MPNRARELGVVVAADHGVLPERHVEDQPLLLAILGDERHARVADLLGRELVQVPPVELDAATRRTYAGP